jgi:hypothetical protein
VDNEAPNRINLFTYLALGAGFIGGFYVSNQAANQTIENAAKSHVVEMNDLSERITEKYDKIINAYRDAIGIRRKDSELSQMISDKRLSGWYDTHFLAVLLSDRVIEISEELEQFDPQASKKYSLGIREMKEALIGQEKLLFDLMKNDSEIRNLKRKDK